MGYEVGVLTAATPQELMDAVQPYANRGFEMVSVVHETGTVVSRPERWVAFVQRSDIRAASEHRP